MQIDGNVLIGYTDWERQKWHDWLQHHSEALKISMGPHGDNQTVGDVVKHIFSSEKLYVERLSDEPLTNTTSIPNDNLEAHSGCRGILGLPGEFINYGTIAIHRAQTFTIRTEQPKASS